MRFAGDSDLATELAGAFIFRNPDIYFPKSTDVVQPGHYGGFDYGTPAPLFTADQPVYDPRLKPGGAMTMQYIPEIDGPGGLKGIKPIPPADPDADSEVDLLARYGHSPRQVPSKKDFDDMNKPGSPLDDSVRQQILNSLKGIKKANSVSDIDLLARAGDGSETWNEGTGIQKEGFDSVPQWLKDKLLEEEMQKLRNKELV